MTWFNVRVDLCFGTPSRVRRGGPLTGIGVHEQFRLVWGHYVLSVSRLGTVTGLYFEGRLCLKRIKGESLQILTHVRRQW